MLESQLREWETAGENYAALDGVLRRTMTIDGYKIRIEHNERRSVSSLAKTDKKTIEKRPCFLCGGNRPKEQMAIDFKGRYDALVNPYPIFPRHFTIAEKRHTEQRMERMRLTDMMDAAKEMEGYVVFYNGAHAGASAPDHFHLQAGNADYLPQGEYEECPFIDRQKIETRDEGEALLWFGDVSEMLRSRMKETEATEGEEPMMNVFCRHEEGTWRLTVIGRRRHRPEMFYREGGLKISPGAVDMAGVIIAARREDYERMSEEDVIRIYEEVSLRR